MRNGILKHLHLRALHSKLSPFGDLLTQILFCLKTQLFPVIL